MTDSTKIAVDGLDDSKTVDGLDDSKTVDFKPDNKVNLFMKDGEKYWSVKCVKKPQKPPEEKWDIEFFVDDKEVEIEFFVNNDDKLVIWGHKGDENTKYKKVDILDQKINKKKINETIPYNRENSKFVASGGVIFTVPIDKIEDFAKKNPNLVYFFTDEKKLLCWIVYYDKEKLTTSRKTPPNTWSTDDSPKEDTLATSRKANMWIDAFSEKHKKAEDILNEDTTYVVVNQDYDEDYDKYKAPPQSCAVMFKSTKKSKKKKSKKKSKRQKRSQKSKKSKKSKVKKVKEEVKKR